MGFVGDWGEEFFIVIRGSVFILVGGQTITNVDGTKDRPPQETSEPSIDLSQLDEVEEENNDEDEELDKILSTKKRWQPSNL